MTSNYYPTGNEYISLPTINEKCEIESMNFLSHRHRGLIEICGQPFLRPNIVIKGKSQEITHIKWYRKSHWIPYFTGICGGMKVTGTYLTPRDRKGFILRLTLESDKDVKGEVGVSGNFDQVVHSINESKPIEGKKHVYSSLWNENLMFDFRTGVTMFSFGFLIDGGFTNCSHKIEADDYISFELLKDFNLVPGKATTFDICFGLGLEEVGAATQAIDFNRETADVLEEELTKWLEDRKKIIEDQHLNKLLNLNMFFNYFYASGKTLDGEAMILCTSRSPRYYVSAAYWDRDSLIWSFPSFLMMDPEVAREALEYVFTVQIRNAGIHSRYIDGTVLEPGFELDELCAFILALNNYLLETKDYDLLEEPFIRKGIQSIYKKLEHEKHDTLDLYKTFLMPTDDMHVYRYLTYNNVLAWKVLGILSEIYDYYGQNKLSAQLKTQKDKVKDAVMSNLVISVDGQKMFAWSGDLEGNHDFYDEPPGSLTMLAYYGFVEVDNVIFTNTYNYLYSSKFAYYFADSNFEELGCSHADHPWILSICNSLLNGRRQVAYDMLERTKMDNYIACESIDSMTGLPQTGEHFGTCAGFLSYAIYESWRTKDE